MRCTAAIMHPLGIVFRCPITIGLTRFVEADGGVYVVCFDHHSWLRGDRSC